jgi:hypothetical protein
MFERRKGPSLSNEGARVRRLSAWFAGLGAALSIQSSAQAQRSSEIEQCVSAHEEGQVLRRSANLKKARELLISCSKATCPSLVRTECAEFLREVENSMPTVVLAAREKGKEVLNVSVFVDGELVTKKLDGKDIPIDPGVHTFKVQLEGWPDIEKDILIISGAKDRELMFDFGEPDKPPPIAPGQPGGLPYQPPPPVETHRPVQAITYILLGTTVLGGVGFGVLGSMGQADKKELEKSPEEGGCAPLCSDDDLSDVKTKFLLADISLGVGVASAIGALVTYLARPTYTVEPATEEKPVPEPETGLRLRKFDVALSSSQGSLRIGGEF